MKIYTAKQLYEADRATVEKQEITPIELMERAAGQVYQWLNNQMQGAKVPIHVFCGIGNNGGDGLALGRMLLQNGYTVKCYVVNYSEKRSKCFLINYDRIKNVNNDWPLLMKSEADFPELKKEDIVIDAIFGIGLNRPLKDWVQNLIKHINTSKAYILSIDIPSGMFIDTPTPDKEAVIKANFTLTFQAPKLVFFLPETGVFTQNLDILNIGLDREYLSKTKTDVLWILKEDALAMYKPREKFSNKGTYGHSII
ncbi:MAG: NAD(P)H-hydrate epimerase, partial [Flavobacteriales bacterium]|nr:NAD(P)H-hydrate epimerase [Flavobacteriales bacterium]